MFIFKVVLVIKRNVMITEQIRTLEYIQEFLGYSSSSKTTEIYTHITKKGWDKIKSLIDNLEL
jgi:site-specific recombinase XerC